jgi:aspartate/methionine/tyrosine aminotransferase
MAGHCGNPLMQNGANKTAVMIDGFPRDVVDQALQQAGIDFHQLDIQELWQQIDDLEKRLGLKYVRMDFGVPGLPPPETAVWTQLQAIAAETVPATYPPAAGTKELKQAASAFLKRFLSLDVDAECCLPTCGATQAAFIAQAVAGRRDSTKNRVVHLEPGYPPVKEQTRFLGLELSGIDLIDYRGARLIEQLRKHCQDGNTAAISWSSPNNPSGITLSGEELRGIAMVCNELDVIAIEDAAYLCMSRNSSPPCARSVAHFTDNFFLLLSASKMFSYAGERVGLLVTSRALGARSYEFLRRFFGCVQVGQALKRAVFNLTAGAPHSAQLALAAAFNDCTRGEYDLMNVLSEYGRRADAVREILVQHRFSVLYTDDPGDNGFYLTFAYPGFSAEWLLKELLCHGIAALPLRLFGSSHPEGLRACVGLLKSTDLERLKQRIKAFSQTQKQTTVTSRPLTLRTNGKEQP